VSHRRRSSAALDVRRAGEEPGGRLPPEEKRGMRRGTLPLRAPACVVAEIGDLEIWYRDKNPKPRSGEEKPGRCLQSVSWNEALEGSFLRVRRDQVSFSG